MKIILFLTVLALIQVSDANRCSSNKFACRDSRCINTYNLCDGSHHCSGGDDEKTAFCNHYFPRNCPKGQVACSMTSSCIDWTTACNNDDCYMKRDSTFCQGILSRTIPTTIEPGNDTCRKDGSIVSPEEMQTFLTTVNNTSNNNGKGCPPFYSNITNECIAFIPFEMTWPEALEACESISGHLIELNVDKFLKLVSHIQKNGLTSDYWIGGFFDITFNDWRWAGGTEMPMGTPYWTVLHSQQCKPRQIAEGRLGEDTTACFRYYQAPSQSEAGQCVALQYENHHYFSNEACTDIKKPLCHSI